MGQDLSATDPEGSGRAQRPRSVLFVSNGLGEDSIAASIIGALPDTLTAAAYPIIGDGAAFDGLSPIVGPRSHVPSQGWRHARNSVAADLPAMLMSLLPAIRFLKAARARYERIVVVGDSVGVLLGMLAGISVDLYLDVFKTGYAHRYSALERFAIRRTAKKVMCRDDMLATQLRNHGVDAVSHGNIMLDTVSASATPIGDFARGRPIIGILPGSRRTTPDNFAFQARAMALIGEKTPVVGYAALASDISPEALAQAADLVFTPLSADAAMGRLTGENVEIILFSGATGNVIDASTLVLSQAGTATQQALGMGRPVITFFPPDHRKKRMADEQALMGEARKLLPPDPQILAATAIALLGDRRERERLGAIGRQRLGGPGTLNAVVKCLQTR